MKTFKLNSPSLSSNPVTVFIRKTNTNKHIVYLDGHTVLELAVYDQESKLRYISGSALIDDDIAY